MTVCSATARTELQYSMHSMPSLMHCSCSRYNCPESWQKSSLRPQITDNDPQILVQKSPSNIISVPNFASHGRNKTHRKRLTGIISVTQTARCNSTHRLILSPNMVLAICWSMATILLRSHWLRFFKSNTSSINNNIICSGMLSSSPCTVHISQ